MSNYTKSQGGKITIKFTEEILGDISGNTAAFSVTGQQYKYVHGPLLSRTYQIQSVAHHPTEPKAILLTFAPLSRFPTVEGDLTVSYNSSLGNLAGLGGAVESFSIPFAPTDLVPEPNPGIYETITAVPTIAVEFLTVEYAKAYAPVETLTAAPASITVALIRTDIINP